MMIGSVGMASTHVAFGLKHHHKGKMTQRKTGHYEPDRPVLNEHKGRVDANKHSRQLQEERLEEYVHLRRVKAKGKKPSYAQLVREYTHQYD